MSWCIIQIISRNLKPLTSTLSYSLKYFLIGAFLFLSCSEISTAPEEEIIICEAPDEWTLLGLENEKVTAIAVDPVNLNVIYAGTASDFSAQIQGKLFKSSNCGKTWDTLLIGGSYREIIIDPLNHKRIYALPGPIIKSEDAGKTWYNISNGFRLNWETRLQSLAIDLKNSDILYAGTGGFFGGSMYKSINGGLDWIEIGKDSLSGHGVISIAIDPVNSNIIYVGTQWTSMVWKSTDGGTSWSFTGLQTNCLIHDINFVSQQPLKVYTASNGIYESQDGGLSWRNLDQGLPEVFYQVMKVDTYSTGVYIIVSYDDDGGIYEYSFSQNRWIKIGIDSLHATYYYSDLAFSSDPERIFFGGRNGIYVKDL
jgi:photosystem II stability/assembly factor-like uncharacterized protein